MTWLSDPWGDPPKGSTQMFQRIRHVWANGRRWRFLFLLIAASVVLFIAALTWRLSQ